MTKRYAPLGLRAEKRARTDSTGLWMSRSIAARSF